MRGGNPQLADLKAKLESILNEYKIMAAQKPIFFKAQPVLKKIETAQAANNQAELSKRIVQWNDFVAQYQDPYLPNVRSFYRFIHTLDTFWVGGCQWTVDSITQQLAMRGTNKNLAIYGARYKYGYDVYLQCTDCVSAYKNEKGECLCSR